MTPQQRADKARIIDSRIVPRIEMMPGGTLLGNREQRMWALSPFWLKRLADRVEQAEPTERADRIIEKVIDESRRDDSPPDEGPPATQTYQLHAPAILMLSRS